MTYENLHAANECIDLDTIAPVYEAYLNAVQRWGAGDLLPELSAEPLVEPVQDE